MVQSLLVINSLLTVPFGVAALLAPAAVFAQFGVPLDAGGSLVARGYAATLIGYGTALWLLRRTPGTGISRPLLLSLVFFNGIEAVIQGAAGLEGLARPIIFANVALHGVVFAACLYAYFTRK